MKKFNIAIDVDDITLELLPTWIALYNEEFDDNLDWKTIDDWGVHKFVKPEAQNRIYQYIEYEDVFWGSLPVEDALENVNKLKEMGHRLFWVTANNPQNVKELWLKENGFLTNHLDFIQAYDKSLILCDFLFDDKYENCRDCRGVGVLKNRPYNLKYNWEPRVNNWSEFVDYIKIMQE